MPAIDYTNIEELTVKAATNEMSSSATTDIAGFLLKLSKQDLSTLHQILF